MHIAPCVRDGQAQACCTTRQAVTPSHHGASYVISTRCEYYLQLAVPDQPHAVHTICVTVNNRVKNRTGCDVLTDSQEALVRCAMLHATSNMHHIILNSGRITKGAQGQKGAKVACTRWSAVCLTVLSLGTTMQLSDQDLQRRPRKVRLTLL